MTVPMPPPFERFREVWDRALQLAPPPPADHHAATLATADGAGRPSARVVLVRGFDEEGLLFYTNYTSRKAREITLNPHAALCFYWHWLEEQVRVEGAVVRASREESDAYFRSRPRGSQIGAWASQQSQPLSDREELAARVAGFERDFEGRDVPRPEFWGGFRLVPDRFEFWKAAESRLHDRWVFARIDSTWTEGLLYP
jgi:pyridoxamine 5'-phosphate oxidase